MRPSLRRTRRTQQALVGLSVVGALGAATTLDLTTQTASAGSGTGSTTTHGKANDRAAAASGGRVTDDQEARTKPAPKKHRTRTQTTQQTQPTQPAQPVAPPSSGSTQATTSGS